MARSQTVEILNPAHGSPDSLGGAVLRFPVRTAGSDLRVAYVDNVKPNTAELFALIDRRLRDVYKVESKVYGKDYGAGPARPGTYEEIARTADIAVTGVAD